jgi:hypothetical protein
LNAIKALSHSEAKRLKESADEIFFLLIFRLIQRRFENILLAQLEYLLLFYYEETIKM